MKKLFSTLTLSTLCLLNIHPVYADKIAIIGGGAAGLVSAWLIEQDHDVTLYEAQDRLGGHADSVEVNLAGKPVVIEAGAEFFNDSYYPHFMRLLHYYNIPLNSFSLVTTFYNTDGKDVIILPPYHDHIIEWKSLTAANLWKEVQLKIVMDNGRKLIAANDTTTTLQQFADSLPIDKSFKTQLLYPLLASAWGASPDQIQNYSAIGAVKYLIEGNDVKGKWYEVVGGLKVYIDAVRDSLENTEIHLNDKVKQISMVNGRYLVTAEDGTSREYDQLIFATDANVASSLLAGMPETSALSTLLNKIQYYDTKIAIHSDNRFMPPQVEDWRIANIRYDGSHAMMSIYKPWKSSTPIFHSWITYDVRAPHNQGGPMPQNLYAIADFRHPIIDHNFYDVQNALVPLQGNQHIWFAGMWVFDNASHESAITSAMHIAEKIAPDSARLKILEG